MLCAGFGHVLAVEPGQAFELLEERFGETNSVTLLKAALGNVHGKAVWFGGPTPSAPHKLWYADATRDGSTWMVRIDDELPHTVPVDLVKLDLEGGERDAIDGMVRSLEYWRPVVVCETADWLMQQKDGVGRQALYKRMHILGYVVAGEFSGDTVWKPSEWR